MNAFLSSAANANGKHLLEAGGALLVVLLAWQLMAEKRENARMRGEIARSTRAFVTGDSLPSLPVRLAAGDSMDVRRLCDGRRPVLLVVSSPACEDCRRLAPEWARLGNRPDLTLLVIEPRDAGQPTPPVGRARVVSARPDDIIRSLRIAQVPSVLSIGTDCRVTAAGTGLSASRSVLTLAGSSPSAGRQP